MIWLYFFLGQFASFFPTGLYSDFLWIHLPSPRSRTLLPWSDTLLCLETLHLEPAIIICNGVPPLWSCYLAAATGSAFNNIFQQCLPLTGAEASALWETSCPLCLVIFLSLCRKCTFNLSLPVKESMRDKLYDWFLIGYTKKSSFYHTWNGLVWLGIDFLVRNHSLNFEDMAPLFSSFKHFCWEVQSILILSHEHRTCFFYLGAYAWTQSSMPSPP